MSDNNPRFAEEESFRLIELETSGENGNEIYFEGVITKEQAAVAILVEGEADGVEIHFNDGPNQWKKERDNSNDTGTYKFFVAPEVPAHNGFTRLRLRVWRKIKARIRVSILVLFKLAKEAWEKISCTGCKKLVRFLILSLVAHLGAALIPAHGVLPESFWELLRGALGQGIQHFLDFIPPASRVFFTQLSVGFVDKFIKALESIGKFFNEAFTPIDDALEFICRMMGLCGKEKSELGAV
jgi:hypothetical protein